MRIKNFEDYKKIYAYSISNPEKFWDEIAQHFHWRKKWDKVLEWNFKDPNVKWFINGKLNITENCLDIPAKKHPDKVAFYFEPNDPSEKSYTITYKELLEKVCQTANALKELGVKKGDRVAIYMPMVPEAVISMLACARIGAIHSVVFGGFSAQSLADRINDAECSLLITADAGKRGNKTVPLKQTADEALQSTHSVKKVLVFRHTGENIPFDANRDVWWHEIIPQQSTHCEPEIMDSEDMLFILYTSGSTGKPKGVVHTTGGYMVYVAYTFLNVFQYDPSDIYWCTADVGWITGHSYIVYGPLLNGATSVIFEGIPTYPDAGRFWQIVDKYKVTHFYTAPTAIRSLETFGTDIIKKYKLDSLKVLGSVGEPINEEAWEWYHKNIGKGRCPIVDTWWQTETGGILISPLAGITPLKPSYATLPLPGVIPVLVDDKGNELQGNDVEGNLCIKFPWPSIIRTTYGNHERCRQTYFSTYANLYFTGDGCKRDKDGYYRITGRVDDVINVSGHRIGTAEVEDAINQHPAIVESAVVGYPHSIKGQGIYAYLIPNQNISDVKKLHKEINDIITKIIGPIAKADVIQIVSGLPKTRSGKIMRRILRKIAEGETSNLGDTTTLLDPSVVEEIKQGNQKSVL
ncbi:MAG: acetyl-coenzyme A synthetase [Bacteroidia bacterium]|nr:MAG: acetyl-coenzyme A synthetase [Bacteroidia bacterium]